MPVRNSALRARIENHRRFFENNEKADFSLARRYFRGDFWSMREGAGSTEIDRIARNILCSKNMIYSIADSALAGLLGPNPRVGVVPRNPEAEKAASGVTAYMDWLFLVNRMRRRAAVALMDAVLCKRGVFKSTWLESEDRPQVCPVDPALLYFDLVARDPEDCRYFIEATPLTRAEVEARITQGLYPPDALSRLKADRYPKWLVDQGGRRSADNVKNLDSWYTIHEYYDREKGIVQHYSADEDEVLLEDRIGYVPYTLWSLNHSGVDCLGVSEVQLVLPQQQAINDLLTHWKQCVYLQIPRIFYDAGRLSEEDLNLAMEAATGAFVGLLPATVMSPDARFANLFYEMPMPQAPEGVKEFIARQEQDAAFISALTELSRGHLVGAKTATEVAVMEAQLRTRLATREGHLHDALEDVARKCFWLASRYMQKPRMVRVSGNKDWTQVSLASLRDVEVDFEAVAYNPVRTNPSIRAETLLQLFPLFQALPPGIVDLVGLVREIVQSSGLPSSILFPEEQARQALLAMINAQTQAAGGGPPPGPGTEAPPGAQPDAGNLPPEIQQALAARAGQTMDQAPMEESPVPIQGQRLRIAAGGV